MYRNSQIPLWNSLVGINIFVTSLKPLVGISKQELDALPLAYLAQNSFVKHVWTKSNAINTTRKDLRQFNAYYLISVLFFLVAISAPCISSVTFVKPYLEIFTISLTLRPNYEGNYFKIVYQLFMLCCLSSSEIDNMFIVCVYLVMKSAKKLSVDV